MRALALCAVVVLLLSVAVRSEEARVTLHMEKAPVGVVLRELARQMKVRLVAPAGLSGVVTVHWDKVPASRALAEIAARCGFSWLVAGGKLVVSVPVVNRPNVIRGGPTQPYLAAPSTTATVGDMGGRRVQEEKDVDRNGVDDEYNTESYAHLDENPFLTPQTNPLSTFSIDVDTASYANVRRMLAQGQVPPKGAVRLEEMINYFTYDYPDPKGKEPFSVTTEVSDCPWAPKHRLLSIGVQGRRMPARSLPPRNLVLLVDVSGSMQPANKLPLLKQSLAALVETLGARDRVAIVVYAGSSGLVLEPTSDRNAIREALSRLEAGGSTNGGAGIELAYKVAMAGFVKGGINRVILCSDGDFNVGTTSQSALVDLIEEKRKGGVFLTVLGFGLGNYKDATMEMLADKGNGNYAYIDSLFEARKVLVEQGGGTLVPIAKDVKIQVELNPAVVGAYRLLGYENRMLRAEDFNNDKKDAGEIGAGQSVTALYEIIPPGEAIPQSKVDPLKYQKVAAPATGGSEMATVKVRYKAPDGDVSQLLAFPVEAGAVRFDMASPNMRFASAVAAFGMLMRGSEHRGTATFASVLEWAQGAQGKDREGYRAGFLEMIRAAGALVRLN